MNTIHPSARVHPSPMSSVKDAVTSAPQDKITKRSANYTVRQDSRHPARSRENDRHAPPSLALDSSSDSATLHAHAPPNHSRQTWTHAAFSKYIPGSDIADKGHYQQHHHLSQAHSHTLATSGLSLAGVCTVLIEPYTFVDTKFYTVLRPALDVKSEPGVTDTSSHPSSRQRHQVVMEFKDNPGALWLFPEEASLEFTPANECKSTLISASFYLANPASANVVDKSESGDQDIKPMHVAVTLMIQHATTALREGLELAVKGTKTTVYPSLKSMDPPSRPHTPSTYSDDPSEILGSGKQSVNNGSSSTKRKQDVVNENQKSLKPKRPKDQDDKATGASKKKVVVVGTGSKKNGLSGTPSNATLQKRCGYCNCTTTPMWRRGPNGPSTLCNACGVKWKHGKILQDVQDTQVQKAGGTSSTSSSSASARATSSKQAKHSQNGSARHLDDTRAENNTTKKRSSSSSSSHAATRRDVDTRSGGKSGSRDNSKRPRAEEPEKIVPVKKRHSSKAASASPPGPRMVSIHELGDPARTPFEGPDSSRKHVYNDDVEELTLPNGQFETSRNGLAHSDHMAPDTASSSASTISTQSDIATTGVENDMEAESTTSNIVVDDDPSGYMLDHLNTNDSTTFPVDLPTISIAFGPSNAYYVYPNCAVILHESHFQIKLAQTGEKTEIDVWKEGIEATEFDAVDVGDGESMIVMKVLLRQYLTRFDKELLNPDRNETLIVFRFRERLDGGGGHSVKPLLDHWLTTDIQILPSLSNDS